MGIPRDQKYRGDRVCPICGGTEDDPRGADSRCWGFLSGDGQYARCSREEFAGKLTADKTGSFAHRLKGECNCGRVHNPADKPAPKATSRKPPKAKGNKRLVAEYDYRDEDGTLLFQAQRFQHEDGSKTFSQRRPDPDRPASWRYSLGDTRRVLYRLPELVKADPTQAVYIVEGEKDCDRLRSLGLVATSNVMGAGKWRDDYSAFLKGRTVRVIADNDGKGRDHAEAVCASVGPVAASVRRLDLAEATRLAGLGELPEKGDASDFLDMGGTVDAIERAFADAPDWQPVRIHRPDERPEIRIVTDEQRVNDAAILALTADPSLYCRGGVLVGVRREKRRSKLVNRPTGSPWIAALPKSNLREKMAHHAHWTKTKRIPNTDEVEIVPTHPPDWSVAAVWDRGEWDGIRHLEGVAEAPAILGDGSLLDDPGYHEASGLIYEPNCDFPPVARTIRQADARRAVGELLEVVADFPFAIIGDDGGATHRAAWLASLLTPLARHAIDGPCPLFFIDANTSGAGKSKLVDIVAILTTGRGAARTAFPESDEEMRKQIISIALEGDRLILIDNVTTGAALGGASLDMVLTGTTIKGRVLGRSEMTRELPIYTVWYATGNNLGLRGDMLRRVIPLRLESPHERPEERTDFRIKVPLLKHVEANRGRLTAAALTILRGYFLAGRPQANLTPMDYPEWCGVVRQAVYWASGFDPCATRRELIEEDPETNQLKAVVNGWGEIPGGRTGLAAAQALKHLSNPDNESRFEALRNALMEWSRDGDLPGPKTVGRRLKQIKGRVIDGKILRAKVSGGTQYWYVTPSKPGGFEGFKGFDSPHAGDLTPDGSSNCPGDKFPVTGGTTPLKPLKATAYDESIHGDAYEGDLE